MNDQSTTIKDCLAAGKPAATYTTGVSMQPLLYEGKTYVIIMPLTRELKKGDLPIYIRPDGVYVIHRVIRTDEEYYYTRGDNCITYEKIPREWVLGEIVQIYRKGRVIKTTDAGYRLYVKVWGWIYPLRCFYKKCRMKASRLVKKCRNRKKQQQ